MSSEANKKLIETLYQSFGNGDASGMVACYHDNIEFEDPAFGKLSGERAKSMWKMLLSRSKPEITFSDVEADENKGSATWVAKYVFQGNPVTNNVKASFEFKDGKIIKHTDDFDFWTWASQALGFAGKCFGWTGFMHSKVTNTVNGQLDKYIAKNAAEASGAADK